MAGSIEPIIPVHNVASAEGSFWVASVSNYAFAVEVCICRISRLVLARDGYHADFQTDESDFAVTVGTSKLSYSEPVTLSKSLGEQIRCKRDEELKVLADGIAKKLQATGFTV